MPIRSGAEYYGTINEDNIEARKQQSDADALLRALQLLQEQLQVKSEECTQHKEMLKNKEKTTLVIMR